MERSALEREIAATRTRGYSRSIREHFEAMMALGLPIFGRSGEVLYIFCILGVVQDLEPVEGAVAAELQRAISEIHQAILSNPPAGFSMSLGVT